MTGTESLQRDRYFIEIFFFLLQNYRINTELFYLIDQFKKKEDIEFYFPYFYALNVATNAPSLSSLLACTQTNARTLGMT